MTQKRNKWPKGYRIQWAKIKMDSMWIGCNNIELNEKKSNGIQMSERTEIRKEIGKYMRW